jgi:ribonuclease D
MQSPFNKPARWIEQQADFERMLSNLAGQKRVAIDTESNSLYAYQEQVCLIQISTETEDYLVDPLADIKLGELGTITADKSIEKIFHAAEYDVICLRRDFSFDFHNLFDTMHTARMLGFEKTGLADMLKNQFGIEQGRSFQKANWGKRPLDDEMKIYARYDTHFLISLRDLLSNQLAGSDLQPLAIEDFALLGKSRAAENHNPLYTQVSGFHKLSGKELRVLYELCKWRDKTAQRMDCPLFKVVGAGVLLEAAKTQPDTLADLQEIKGVSARVARRHGAGLLKAVRVGLNKPPLEQPKRKRPSRAYAQRMDDLSSWRKKTARELKVKSDIILPRAIMEKIACGAPVRMSELRTEMVMAPWRFEQFGGEIMAVLQKGI